MQDTRFFCIDCCEEFDINELYYNDFTKERRCKDCFAKYKKLEYKNKLLDLKKRGVFISQFNWKVTFGE